MRKQEYHHILQVLYLACLKGHGMYKATPFEKKSLYTLAIEKTTNGLKQEKHSLVLPNLLIQVVQFPWCKSASSKEWQNLLLYAALINNKSRIGISNTIMV